MKEKMQEGPKAKNVAAGISRRKFLTFTGGLAGATLLLDACKKGDDGTELEDGTAIDMGTGDAGVFNYLNVLEQMESDFFIRVMDNAFPDMTREEKNMLEDMRDHDIAHREFTKNINGTKANPILEFDFTGIDFSSRQNVLTTASSIKEIVVSAYNFAAAIFATPGNLVLSSKIASVEARHAAILRNTLRPGSFADTADANGIDKGLYPSDILALIKPYLKSNISFKNLPKSKSQPQ